MSFIAQRFLWHCKLLFFNQLVLFVSNTADCGELQDPLNGFVSTTGRVAGSTATYSCALGYNLMMGDNPRTCSSQGQWTGEVPTCQSTYHIIAMTTSSLSDHLLIRGCLYSGQLGHLDARFSFLCLCSPHTFSC